MKKVGIIGCGAIGTIISNAADKGIVKCDKLILYDRNLEKAERIKKSMRNVQVEIVKSLDGMLKLKPTVIVEAASQEAVREYAEKILAANIELIVMSVGALLNLKIKSNKIHIPSGAIGGLDAISSAMIAGIDKVTLTTRKNPKALDVNQKEGEKLIFEGTPIEAVKRFPKEMNVAATLALTTSPNKVHVQVIADPNVNRNVHEVRVKWKYGEMLFKFSNMPHPENPRTSALAAWSAINLLKKILEKYV
ncbi:aspartate dehydrogenase [Candidatus Bathyarchaeota archaeon]|nr:aspartate dehydrogenase [Candidatus Bathyarchaeota archaeon]